MSGYHRLTYGFHALSLMLAVTLCAGISAVSASYEENGAWEYIGDDDGVALYRALRESEGLLPFSKRRTEVTFTFSGDLGGWIPSFVKTIIQKKWPVRFIQSLQHYVTGNETLETDRYRRLQKKNFVLPP